MVSNKKHLIWCSILLALNTLFIWGNSILPGSVSAAISQLVRDFLSLLFSGNANGDPEAGHGILRKIAHFLEFCSLGALFCWLFSILGARSWKGPALPFLCSALTAAVDETIQFFVPGRNAALLDIGIDALGAALGIVILYFTIKKHHKSQYLEEQTL